MPFSSLLFLTGFLPAFLLAYWCVPARGRNYVALAFSIFFYFWGAPAFLPVVLALGVIDYFIGHGIHRARTVRWRRLLLIGGVIVHLSTLSYFKYSNFIVEQLNRLLALAPGAAHLSWAPVVLPIGISFITFEEISYLVDVYRGDARPAGRLSQYLLFLMLFPHSIAGPIFRWKDLEAQLRGRQLTSDGVLTGFRRFSMGLASKVLIANSVAVAVDPIFAMPPTELTTAVAWLGAVGYSLQIYFDFSGYSDMAIGLGLMAGFRFKENFDQPYIAASITEFWRRWHISLSTWLRDYLYIPLGGGRRSTNRVLFNVMTVFFLSGLWHGANWTFVVWGIYHGMFVILERGGPLKSLQDKLPRLVNVTLTFTVVTIGWVFFRAPDLTHAAGYLAAMAGHTPATSVSLAVGAYLPHRTLAMYVLGLAICFMPLVRSASEQPRRTPLVWALAPAALILSMVQLANSKFNPLIYFKF